MQASGATRDGAIGENENGSEGVGVLRNLSRDVLLEELVLLSVGEARTIEDANLGRRLYIITTFTMLVLTAIPFLLVNS